MFITHQGADAWANIDIHPRQPQQFLRLIALDDGALILRTRLPRGLSVAIDLSPDATRDGDLQVLP